ncbi:MAG: anthranilate phosphoribosyltransferase [Candidatus Aminicenantes bacterium]|nr:anthranilate phosphoribosyltransferase [Candidatus Aminicenantes bacterium]
MIKEAISVLSQGKSLAWVEMEKVMTEIFSKKTTAAQIGAFLMALKMKGEKVEEILGGVTGMLSKAVRPKIKREDLIDLCGTGGDGRSTFSVSTISSFVAAGAGVGVAKHGNRSVSSRCGSADLMEALGADLSLSPLLAAKAVDDVGFGFLFAPLFHPAMRIALRPRQEIGVRTLFNIIGPLANPVRVKRQLLGVYDENLLLPVSRALQMMGTEKALVVHSRDGLDEISVCAPTQAFLVGPKKIKEMEIFPEEYGRKHKNLASIQVRSVEENVCIFRDVMAGKKGAARDMVLLNAGAAVFVSGAAADLRTGVEMARKSLDSGRAEQTFIEYMDWTRRKKS